MAKRFLKLTERDLHEMVIGAVNQILNEIVIIHHIARPSDHV